MKWDSGALTTSTYDAANQLETASGPAGVTTFSYDLTGNLTVQNAPAGITTSTWDNENRQSSLNLPTGASPLKMTYNADGLRFSANTLRVTPLTLHFLWDGKGLLGLAESGTLVPFYVREPLEYGGALYSYGGLFSGVYFAYDALGSMVSRWVVGTGVSGNFYYKAFGEPLNVGNDGVNADDQFFWVGRSGYFYDSLTGQYSAGRRYYDPVTGRWIQIDIIRGDARGDDFCYVGNNAVNAADPSGLYSMYPAACVVTERKRNRKRAKTYCRYDCTCPNGGTLGFTPGTYWRDCNASPPAPNCVVLDYVDVACLCLAAGVAMCDSPAPSPADALGVGILGARGLTILLP